jgi:hypothetical protein
MSRQAQISSSDVANRQDSGDDMMGAPETNGAARIAGATAGIAAIGSMPVQANLCWSMPNS